MLGLLKPTDPSWVDAARSDLRGLLSDHAHCELKAAQNALALVGRFGGEHPELTEPLLQLAEEETDHFRQVEAKLRATGGALSYPESDPYVAALRKASNALDQADRAPRLLDRLMVAALIEARSCERFKLLAEHLDDEPLSTFYADLMASEAKHYRLFRDLGCQAFGEAAVRDRFQKLADLEAEIASELPLGPTVHG
ncbi:MAG: tRNA isopentenyl-2-thiomethyl-A-37 hydroxylase MiaE [Myxococcota bacterium]